MPGLNLGEVLNPKSKERGILCNKCFMKSTHSMVMPTEIWQFSLLSLSLLHFPIHASGHTIEPCCSCPCLWSLIHHFSDIALLCLEEASRRDTTFPEFLPLCTSASNLLAALFHCFHPIFPVVFPFLLPFHCFVSLGGKWPHSVLGWVLALLKRSTLTLASLDNLCTCLQTCAFAKVRMFLPGSGSCGFNVPQNSLKSLNTSEKKGQEQSPTYLLLLMVRHLRGSRSLLPCRSGVLLSSNFITLFRHLGQAVAFFGF